MSYRITSTNWTCFWIGYFSGLIVGFMAGLAAIREWAVQ
jgi:hypothetical protein